MRKLSAATVLAVVSLSSFALAAQPNPATRDERSAGAPQSGAAVIQQNPSGTGSRGQSTSADQGDRGAMDLNLSRGGVDRSATGDRDLNGGGRYGWEHGRRYG